MCCLEYLLEEDRIGHLDPIILGRRSVDLVGLQLLRRSSVDLDADIKQYGSKHGVQYLEFDDTSY